MRNIYAYSPYGEVAVLGPDGGNSLQYTGRENDGTGLYFYRARYYDPVLKRFVSEDPAGISAGLNFYGFVDGDPISKTDPLGLDTYMCKAPLHALGGSGVRSGTDVPGNPLYHQFLCVTDGKGGYICGGQDRQGSAFFPGSPGKPTDDRWPSNASEACEVQDKKQCVDQCVIRKINDPKRPWYAIGPHGTDCQEWADHALRACQRECRAR